MHRTQRHVITCTITCTAMAVVLAACGGQQDATDPSEPVVARVATTADPPATTDTVVTPTQATTTTSPQTTAAQPATTVAAPPSEEELIAQIEEVLTRTITPGEYRWDADGVAIPPTAAVAAVRMPGREDVLVGAGENLDGTPVDIGASFGAAGLAESLLRTIAFQMIDEGALDPNATIDRWAPNVPNADRVTVQMLIDGRTGWGDWGAIEPDPILTDLSRAWTLQEVVDARAPVIAVDAEPGTHTDSHGNNEVVLGLILERVGGRSLVDLVRERVSEPAGLADTGLLINSVPEGYRHGLFGFNGAALDTSAFDRTSMFTWGPSTAAVSTLSDLLDLLDVWESGALFTTDRTPAPDRYTPDPMGNPALEYHAGIGVPFNGFCPCSAVDGGIEPTAYGRTVRDLGTHTYLLRYADGTSVVMNVNTSGANTADLLPVVDELHALAASST